MEGLISNIARTYKSRLEISLFLCRIGLDDTLRPSMNDPNLEEKFLHNVSTMKKRQHNAILTEYYYLGQHLATTNKRFRSGNTHQRIALFMYEYYKDEPEAIQYLENIAPATLDRLNHTERAFILNKPPNPPPILGQDANGADDLWQVDSEQEDSIEVEEEPLFLNRPSKRRRATSKSTVTPEPFNRSVTPEPAPIRSINPLGITAPTGDCHFGPTRSVYSSLSDQFYMQHSLD